MMAQRFAGKSAMVVYEPKPSRKPRLHLLRSSVLAFHSCLALIEAGLVVQGWVGGLVQNLRHETRS